MSHNARHSIGLKVAPFAGPGVSRSYQGTALFRSEKVPDGPSDPAVASLTISSVPSSTVWTPCAG